MSNAALADNTAERSLRLVRGPRPVAGPETDVFSGLRVVRTVAMLSIVAYHVTWQPAFGIAFGLTSLQVILCALAGRGAGSRPHAPFARKRARRLLLPWFAWSGVYGLFELVRSAAAGRPLASGFEPSMWATGASFHLWFLPFGFAASICANALLGPLGHMRPRIQSLVCGAAGALLLLSIDGLKLALTPAHPFELWIDGAPTLCFGLAVGRALSCPRPQERASLLLTSLVFAALPFALAHAHVVPASGLFERYAVAVGVVGLGFLVPSPRWSWIETLAATNLGVYLVHMLAIRAVDHLPSASTARAPVRSLVVYAVCLLAVAAIRRTKLRWLA